MSMHLSAVIGKPVTTAQLLGTEKEELALRKAEAEKEAAKLLKRMRKAGL